MKVVLYESVREGNTYVIASKKKEHCSKAQDPITYKHISRDYGYNWGESLGKNRLYAHDKEVSSL